MLMINRSIIRSTRSLLVTSAIGSSLPSPSLYNQNSNQRFTTSTINLDKDIENNNKWKIPNGFNTGIMVKNSLIKHKKVPLITENKKNITWYTCGPTVYSNTHIGHARNYMSVDIIQRILTNYFGINITHVMGMTDVDDKIINKSIQEKSTIDEISRKYEYEFINDMKLLGIKPPLFTTRVSEHINDIIEYIGKIQDNQLTYQSGKSVLFDVGKFGFARYNILRENNVNTISDDNLMDKNKKSLEDFVLWKAYNEKTDIDGNGNPVYWDSPFGKGRPGWHIECSAMINSIFKDKLDIHSGGIDLEFPHHQNEIAQCEGHHSTCKDPEYQWANYFLHIGHLSIQGQKMSKSLKNFIKIEEFLEKYSASQMRWLCLLHKYNDPLSFSEETMNRCIEKELKFLNWFKLINIKIQEKEKEFNISIKRKYKETRQLFEYFNLTKTLVENDLLNDFDTPNAIERLYLLTKKTNEYIDIIDTDLLYHIKDYIDNTLNIFGINCNSIVAVEKSGENHDTEKKQEFLIDQLMNVRLELKKIVKESELSKSTKSSLYKISDQIRDNSLNEIGLRIIDQPSETKPYTLEWLDKHHLQLIKQQQKNKK
ncbi:hypothetical protein CYY_000822 [Polysphondylium violaceum]|uniref:cysteine--tRNA ligase n=1 Tax=Polysphondylium violaceum TaxID=133409 RepID=A0A8J4Q351_9MYCE|nr:hypothetical protein CYY_000822 [Polysphondylium violaceum]